MANVIDYIKWRGDLSFSVSPFNEVDSLIFTQLMYLDFREIVGGMDSEKSISLAETGRQYFRKNSRKAIEEMPLVVRDSVEIFREMIKYERFRGCRFSKYVRDVSRTEEYQFCAMRIEVPDHSCYLAFSGTDSSMAGWKENFNMSYLQYTPGQRKAVEYVEQTISSACRNVRLGGHSKGGNLAVYAAIKSDKEVQSKVAEVYNFDGPGFTKEMVTDGEYQRVIGKIRTIVPQSSIIGVLLEREERFEIIDSSETGLMQHRAISWMTQGPRLVRVKELSERSLYWEGTLHKWIDSLDGKERQQFVNAVFMIFENANITDTDQLKNITLRRFLTLLRAIDRLKDEERDSLHEAVKKLLREMDRTSEKMLREMDRASENN